MRRYREAEVSFGPPLTRVVKNLIIITAAIFVVTLILEGRRWAYPSGWFGLTPYLVTHKLFLWQAVTYLFLHAGFFHVIFNLFALWMFGSDLERMWGPRRFLFYFFLTGIGAAVCEVLLQPSRAFPPTVGNSGAVYGVLLAYGLLFPERPILFALIVPIKAKWFVVIMGAIAFLSALATPGSVISHVAHLGGMLFGFLYLRGRSLPYWWELRYHAWRRARLRRQFEVYMRRREKKDQTGRWIH